jgi:peptidoglycan/xylan/chitin deacetylase (PgdA/CDA1 family)
MIDPNLKSVAIQISAASQLQYVLASHPETSLTTLLFHNFFIDGEIKESARERLKRQLDWLRRKYAPLDLNGALSGVTAARLPNYPLLITVDDVEADLLEVYDIFEAFDVPVALFVCAGWTSEVQDIGEEAWLARIITAMQWYQGPDFKFMFADPRLTLRIGTLHRATVIEQILKTPEEYRDRFHELIRRLGEKSKIGDRVCTWSELADLVHRGAGFGCHSVSHVPLASVSPLRIAFEVRESQRLTELRLGRSSVFAYPYGGAGSFNGKTSKEIRDAGFAYAFLTHSDFANATTNPLHLPRIALPDRVMSLGEFQARVNGGGIALQKAKEAMMRVNPFRN